MDRLITAASEEFKRCGFASATTAAIADIADVTEAQLFRYFGSKADLFREAIFKPLDRHFHEFHSAHVVDAAQAEPVRDNTNQYITELHQLISDHSKMLMSLLVAQTYTPDSAHGDIDSLQKYFERGAALMTSRVDNPKVDPKLMVRVSFAAVLGCVVFKDWIFPAGLAGKNKIRRAIIDFVIDGISASDPGFDRTKDPGMAPTPRSKRVRARRRTPAGP